MSWQYYGCYILSALAIMAATAFMLFADDKALGVFFVIIAVIVARVLILNVAERLPDRRSSAADKRADDDDAASSAGGTTA